MVVAIFRDISRNAFQRCVFTSECSPRSHAFEAVPNAWCELVRAHLDSGEKAKLYDMQAPDPRLHDGRFDQSCTRSLHALHHPHSE